MKFHHSKNPISHSVRFNIYLAGATQPPDAARTQTYRKHITQHISTWFGEPSYHSNIDVHSTE